MKVGLPPDETARDRIDGLVCVGILRRGNIIRCTVCHHLAFIPIDDLAANIRCPRCQNTNALERERWRSPVGEPKWFYDLHPTARALLHDNGHVPLLLSQYLRDKAKASFTDAPEFELFDEEGNRVVETDLLALADRQLIVSEAKSNATFGNKPVKAARKRALVAKLLKADEVVLATTADSWEPASISAMKTALQDESWPRGPRPRLRTISRLGRSEVIDQVLDMT